VDKPSEYLHDQAGKKCYTDANNEKKVAVLRGKPEFEQAVREITKETLAKEAAVVIANG
jgi:hypothetical protein